eukprot:scaffold1386_cov342-Pavlova_lutheri.AAC.20
MCAPPSPLQVQWSWPCDPKSLLRLSGTFFATFLHEPSLVRVRKRHRRGMRRSDARQGVGHAKVKRLVEAEA